MINPVTGFDTHYSASEGPQTEEERTAEVEAALAKAARRANRESETTRVLVPGRYGFSGSHVHVCEVTSYIRDEGKPWQATVITSARPLCSGVRRGDKRAHSLQMNTELTTKTITCEKCREFGCVKEG